MYALLEEVSTRIREFREFQLRKSPLQLVAEGNGLFREKDVEETENPDAASIHPGYLKFLLTKRMNINWAFVGLGDPVTQTNWQSGQNHNTQVGGSQFGNCGDCKLPAAIERLTDKLINAVAPNVVMAESRTYPNT